MAYNTIADIRTFCNMSSSIPTDGVITTWQKKIDAMIEHYNPSPDSNIAAIIEMNKINEIYHKKEGFVIPPLSDDDKAMLSNMVDEIEMNGVRYYESYRSSR